MPSGTKPTRDDRLTAALRDSVDAVSAARQDGNQELLIASLRKFGQIERDLGRPSQALAPYQEAVALCRATGPKTRLAHAIRHLGDLLVDLCRPGEAAVEYEAALAIYRSEPSGVPLDLANALRGYALAKEALGEHDNSERLWIEAREIYSGLGIEAGVAECNGHLVSR